MIHKKCQYLNASNPNNTPPRSAMFLPSVALPFILNASTATLLN
jgi:hypothetical protein